jgi:transposase InsO family protein
VRVDNGAPWGSAGDLPTDLALWLFGLGVEVIWNPPRRPQDNGVVERSQGTGKRWAEPHTCRDADELQRRLDDLDAIQRQEYPSIAGKTRAEAFPGLAHSGRAYDPKAEASWWDRGAVVRHLSGYTAVRRADPSGNVSVYNRNRYVGTGLKGKTVYVTLDPQDVSWVFQGRDGVCYRRQPAEELSAERVIGLQVTNRRDRSPRSKRQTLATGLPAPPHVA